MSACDLVVIGGGITGLGIARLAARNGFSVTLFERGDLAGGASSASSHMLHGGLRYLEHGAFTLVREALRERAELSRMAPDLARPTRFMIPFYRDDRRPPWQIRAGLWLYDAFAGRDNLAPHAAVRAREALALEPDLAPDDLRGTGMYSDVVMDDARLAIAVARDAAAQGADIQPHTEVIGARPADGGATEVLARDRLQRAERRVTARLVINATGPWTDGTRTTLSRSLKPGSPDPTPLLRPTRGVHLIFPALTRGHGLLVLARSDGRPFFVVPFGAHSIVGTTEIETSSPPATADCAPSAVEIAYLREELGRALPQPARLPMLAVTSGVRPLLAGQGDVHAASREHRIVDEGPVLTVAGGKYTTFRAMARDTLALVRERLGRASLVVRDPVEPLPAPPSADLALEARTEFAVAHEFARRLEDVVRRRTHLWLSPDRGRVAAPAVAATMARALGWSPERMREELHALHAVIDRDEHALRLAQEHA